MSIYEIELAPYDPDWPAAFDAEAVRLRAALGTLALRIDHNGSTSIPGLPAKPIIDIQVSVAALQPIAAFGEVATQFASTTAESREGYARAKTDFTERVVALACAAVIRGSFISKYCHLSASPEAS